MSAAPAPAPPPVDSTTPPTVLPVDAASSWARPQIEAVVAAGVMGPSVAEFRPQDPLTWGDLIAGLNALGRKAPAIADTTRTVRLREFDAQLVRALRLSKAAQTVRKALAAAGLKPNARVGNETVARLIGLRLNHPQAEDPLELGPDDPITRAEAAYSFAKALDLGQQDLSWVKATVGTLQLPALSEWQARVLGRAIGFVGFPYIWGGSSEKRQAPFGVSVPGGFDCSGFVWRVYKTQPYEGDALLPTVLQGRTTYVMSAEVKPEQRIPGDQLQPGDVLFFGDDGATSTPDEVGHMGIYLAPGWMVHSSSNGTTIAQFSGWYADRFAWARRPLAEAGLG
ncbi:MAG: C40 family peptidase [Thermoleophilia bacterium]